MKKLTSFLLVLMLTLNIVGVASFSVGAISPDGAINTEVEPNNIFKQAQIVEPDQVVHGSITYDDIIDFYKITLTERRRVTVYTLGTHFENYDIDGYESLAFDIYQEKTLAGSPYRKIDKNSCYYDHKRMRDLDFDLDIDGFTVDNEKWEQTEDMVLDAGTYYFVFKFDSLSKSEDYKFMYKLGDPVPALYNRYHKDEFNLDYKTVSAGDYTHLRVSDGEVAKWKSSDKSVATVNKNGKVAALKKGNAIITAKLTDGTKLEYYITVANNPTLKEEKLTLKVSNSKKIKVEGAVGKIKYTSKNTKIATVNKNGKVVAKAPGTAKIKVKVNGVKLTCEVNVKK